MSEVINGWRWDPSELVWWARVGDRWITASGTFEDPPAFSPEGAARQDDFDWFTAEGS